jgi:Flp pilus assembly protein TadG
MRALQFVRCTSGSAVVEAAVVVPLAIALMVGGVEFGRAIFNYHTVDKSLRNATRYLARVPSPGVSPFLDQAKNLALRGTIDGSGEYFLSSWTAANTITIDNTLLAGTPPRVRLTASVPFTFAMLPSIGRSAQMTFTVSHEERLIGE